ncbi:unnamed protein product [Choristocarpus tenellus]
MLGIAGDALFGKRPDSWWTGPKPEATPGMQANGQLSSLPQLKLSDCSRQTLLDYFNNTWVLTEVLFSSLQGEESFLCPPKHRLRHPLIFYYGHPAALYINKLRAAGLLQGPVNPYLEAILETGVDEMSWDDVDKSDVEWPSVSDVHAYRCTVYGVVKSIIETASEEDISSITSSSPYWALPMAFEHERIHLETSSVLMREMDLKFLMEPMFWPNVHPSSSQDQVASPIKGVNYPTNQLISVDGGSVTIGKHVDFPSYGWDNEYGSRTFSASPFQASQYLISNGEFLEFVKDAGYARNELWTEDGWGWKMFRNIKHPQFWVPQGPTGLHEYSLRLLFEETHMPWDWPVIVNFHEAKAFASWKTLTEKQTGAGAKAYRLETELEHHLIRDGAQESSFTPLSEGIDPVLSTKGCMSEDSSANLNLSWGSEAPVDALPTNGKGFSDVFGNTWEWCEDNFSALDNFNINPLYEDFSTPCFDGQHHIIKGGSFASSGNLASVFARYHFRPHFYQHAGFRLVAPVEPDEALNFVTSCTDAPPPYVGGYPFRRSLGRSHGKGMRVGEGHEEEDKTRVKRNISMHYGNPLQVENDPAIASSMRFPQRCGELVLRMLQNQGKTSEQQVLDIGCGSGGAAFEMTKGVGKVVAVDSSKCLIEAATTMASDRRLTVQLPSSERLMVSQEAMLEEGVDPSAVEFLLCDPMSLLPSMTDFDAVLMHNVIDAVPSPNGLLARMGGARGVVRPGGIVIIVSGYDWNEAITPKGGWLGGYEDENGNKVSSLSGISRGLGSEFKLIHQEVLPCAVPLSELKFMYISAEATVWRRE